jgi:hypothetical protein
MTNVEKAKSFIDQVTAVLKGDTAEATAIKIQRQANSALEVQIAVNNGKTVGLEDRVDSAIEALQLAKINSGVLISEGTGDDYVQRLIIAMNNVTDAEDVLEEHLKTIEFLKDIYHNIGKAEK